MARSVPELGGREQILARRGVRRGFQVLHRVQLSRAIAGCVRGSVHATRRPHRGERALAELLQQLELVEDHCESRRLAPGPGRGPRATPRALASTFFRFSSVTGSKQPASPTVLAVKDDCVSVGQTFRTSSGARGRHSPERASSVGERGSPHSSRDGFALRSRSALPAREQRLAGARRRGASRPRPFLRPSSRGVFDARRGARAVPRRRRSGRRHRVARPRSRLFPRARRRADAVASATRARPARPDRARRVSHT